MATINESLSEGYVIPDQVLIEILLRLPLLSLQTFRSVSKHWLSLITSEYFIRRLQKPRIETPCGLFILERDSEYYDFVSLGPKVTSFPLRATIAEAGSYFAILHSCNGLFLCRNVVSSRICYYVYNPFTNLVKNIPYARGPWRTNMRLAFDPTKSPYYKVVVTGKGVLHWDWGEDWEQYWEQDQEGDWEQEGDRVEDWEGDQEQVWEEDIDTEQILIYSSKTGKWRICGLTFHEDRFWGIGGGIYWNNAIHWIHYDDNNLPSHSKLDIVDHPVVTNIQTPVLDNLNRKITLFESRGTLLLLMEDYDCCYHVFQMREESSRWSVKYIIDDIANILPDLYSCDRVLCIILGQREDDSFMVIESNKEIVRYNFVSKTVSKICSLLTTHCFFRIPFIASLAGV